MTRIVAALLLLLALAVPAAAQIPGGSGVQLNITPVTGSPAPVVGDCLTIVTGNKVGQAACGAGSVTTFSAGTTGFTPSSATAGAVTLAGILNGANGGTGIANTGKTITLGGNLTTSGAFASTFTMTNTTSVTFPTSGTLLSSASTIPLTVGATTIASGTTTRILYDNAGVLGEYTLSGSGTVVAMQTAPTFLTSITHGVGPAILTSPVAANTQLGAAAVDTAPVAQTLSVQNTLAGGTSNVAGANFTIAGSQGKGTGIGGKIIFQGAAAGSTGTTVNALSTLLTLDPDLSRATFTGVVFAGNTIQTAATTSLGWQGRSLMLAPSDGVIDFTASDGSTKAALTMGNITSSGQLNVTAMTQTAAAQSGTVCYNSGTGAVTYDATLGCLASSSAFKTDIHSIQPRRALQIAMALEPVSFRKRPEFGGDVDKALQVGFIAERVADVDERLVGRDDNGTVRGVRYQQLTAILAGAIQELKSEVDALKARR